MQGFRSPGGLQRFVSIFSVVRNHFVPPQSLRPAPVPPLRLATLLHRLNAMAQWKAVAGIAA
jgi:putative transposase